jgi:hypothetical protein
MVAGAAVVGVVVVVPLATAEVRRASVGPEPGDAPAADLVVAVVGAVVAVVLPGLTAWRTVVEVVPGTVVVVVADEPGAT